eukprot:SAG11_NODE_186_length_13142_cov_17.515679_10_plen_72_part_00
MCGAERFVEYTSTSCPYRLQSQVALGLLRSPGERSAEHSPARQPAGGKGHDNLSCDDRLDMRALNESDSQF